MKEYKGYSNVNSVEQVKEMVLLVEFIVYSLLVFTFDKYCA